MNLHMHIAIAMFKQIYQNCPNVHRTEPHSLSMLDSLISCKVPAIFIILFLFWVVSETCQISMNARVTDLQISQS